MSEAQRLTPADLNQEDPYAWASSTPEPEPEKAPRFTPEEALDAARRLCDEAVEAETAAVALESLAMPAAQHMEETLDPALLVEAVDRIQRAKKTLTLAEGYLARALGRQAREAPILKKGQGPGFTWEVKGGATRRAWDHQSWKDDTRRAIVEGLDLKPGLVLLDPETGEELPVDLKKTLYLALELAQSVHGAAAPKTTALRPLGLNVGDYCEEYPGPFTITITADVEGADPAAEFCISCGQAPTTPAPANCLAKASHTTREDTTTND